MYVELTPYDSLLFRNAKSFDMSFDFFAQGHAVPPLTTVFGALGALYYHSHPEQLELAGTENDPFRKARVQGLFYHIRDKMSGEDLGHFVPTPGDLLPVDDNVKGDWVDMSVAPLAEYHKLSTSARAGSREITHFLDPEYEGKGIGMSLLNVEDLKRYLRGETKFRVFKFSNTLSTELKIGIKINRGTRSVEQSHFYSVILNRYETKKYQMSFVVRIELGDIDPQIFNDRVIKLGGEGRFIHVNLREDLEDIDALYEDNTEGEGYRKMYCLTPVLDTKEIRDKIIGLAVTGQELVAGFDMVKRRPKPLRRASAAGSVIYFDGDTDISQFNGRQLSNWEAHYGYNTVLTGIHRSETT